MRRKDRIKHGQNLEGWNEEYKRTKKKRKWEKGNKR